MSTALAQKGYQGLLIANGLTQKIKHFEGLYTQIAISENGYIAIYHPFIPEVKKGFMKPGSPELPEWLEVLHISQINDFDLDVDGIEKTAVSGGFGGAIVGGLLGGAVGSVIGSAATSGKVKTNTTINSVDLVFNTKDFNNPQVRVRLYNGYFQPGSLFIGATTSINFIPLALREHFISKGGSNKFTKEGAQLIKEKYNNGIVNTPVIEALQTTLIQLLEAQKQSKSQTGNADELAKFKSLLDSGVISQEEFFTKKRQLLGL